MAPEDAFRPKAFCDCEGRDRTVSPKPLQSTAGAGCTLRLGPGCGAGPLPGGTPPGHPEPESSGKPGLARQPWGRAGNTRQRDRVRSRSGSDTASGPQGVSPWAGACGWARVGAWSHAGGLHLGRGQARGLWLRRSCRRRGPALAEATLQSCLAAPRGHQGEGGAALSCAISELALSPAAKSPGGGCDRGPHRHLTSRGAAALFSVPHRGAWEQMERGSHVNCASISDTEVPNFSVFLFALLSA